MKKEIKIDLDNPDEAALLNSAAVARVVKVTPQYAKRVLTKKQPGIRLKERLMQLFGHRAA